MIAPTKKQSPVYQRRQHVQGECCKRVCGIGTASMSYVRVYWSSLEYLKSISYKRV